MHSALCLQELDIDQPSRNLAFDHLPGVARVVSPVLPNRLLPGLLPRLFGLSAILLLVFVAEGYQGQVDGPNQGAVDSSVLPDPQRNKIPNFPRIDTEFDC